jgi:hypothetical protein
MKIVLAYPRGFCADAEGSGRQSDNSLTLTRPRVAI